MKKFLTGTCFLALFAFHAPAAQAETLPLKRVILSTSGVALFEHRGEISGNATLSLPVRLDQVDDMLKSLVVLDSKGALGGVTLPGREPLAQSFRDLPFTREDLNSLTGLLNALQGADVEIAGPSKISGRLMNVAPETEETESHGLITRNRIGVMTPEGLKTAVLEKLDALKFSDPAAQAQLTRALEAVYSNRIRDQRQIDISLQGAGKRGVSLAYVEEAPLWKSAYRLVLPAPDAPAGGSRESKAFLQGWAVLENTTALDWKDVSVTLMSGSPVTYKQQLYESYYLPRPELPVKVMDRIMPHVDTGTLGTAEEANGTARAAAAKEAARSEMFARKSRMAMASAMAYDSADGSYGAGLAAPEPTPDFVPGTSPMPAAPVPMASASTALAQEASSQLVFVFPQPVSLQPGNSLMIPFVSRELAAERVYVYQPDTNAQHPLSAVSLKNQSDSGLPPGILTLYDNAKGGGLLHVGDAEMPLVPKDETRFISFALDAKTAIDKQEQQDRTLGMITLARGALNQKIVSQNTTTYTIKAPADEARTVVIEQPRRPEWELAKPQGLEGEPEVTPDNYRLKIAVPAGKTKVLKVTLRHEGSEIFSLMDIAPGELDTRMAAAGKDLSPDLRRALEKIKTLRAAVHEQEVAHSVTESQREAIYADQQRLRENLKTVSGGNDLGKRYLKQMNDQEDALAKLRQEEDAIRAKLESARGALSDYVNTLEL